MIDNINKNNIVSRIKAGKSEFPLDEFVSEIQGFLLGLRLTHWKTTSYEIHKASEQTEGTLFGLIDDFVEAYIGSIGGIRPKFSDSIESITDPDRIITCLHDLESSDSSLLNIRDEMLQALYKFKYLLTLK